MELVFAERLKDCGVASLSGVRLGKHNKILLITTLYALKLLLKQ
jgi:hypothetical protein